jgi:hypothetical protein
MKDMVAGGLAGCLEVTVMYPTEYVKTQLQLQTKGNKLYTGMLDCGVCCLFMLPPRVNSERPLALPATG